MIDEKMNEAREYEENHRITVGELKEQLKEFSDDTEITFGNTIDAVPLIFYRTKIRSNNLVQIELNEVTEDFLE